MTSAEIQAALDKAIGDLAKARSESHGESSITRRSTDELLKAIARLQGLLSVSTQSVPSSFTLGSVRKSE